jgi:hypothetical protein
METRIILMTVAIIFGILLASSVFYLFYWLKQEEQKRKRLLKELDELINPTNEIEDFCVETEKELEDIVLDLEKAFEYPQKYTRITDKEIEDFYEVHYDSGEFGKKTKIEDIENNVLIEILYSIQEKNRRSKIAFSSVYFKISISSFAKRLGYNSTSSIYEYFNAKGSKRAALLIENYLDNTVKNVMLT